jgi:hypothetical protein
MATGTELAMQGCGSHNHNNRRSKACLEYHIFHHPGLTFILVGVPLHTLLRGTGNGECLKMAVGHQGFLTSFACTVNHAAEDELEEDLLQQVMATTLEEE